MSLRLALTYLLPLFFALSLVRTLVFKYLSQPPEGQGPRVSRFLRRLLPRLARNADRARTSTDPERFPIERRKTYRSTLRVLVRHNRELLGILGQVVLLVLYFVFLVQGEQILDVPPWLWGLAVVGAFALLGVHAIQQEGSALLALLPVVDERLVRSGRPAQLWPPLTALLERLTGTVLLSFQALAVLVLAPVVTWDNLRLARVSELTWILLATTTLVLLTFDTFHRVRVELVKTVEEAEAQLSTPSPSPDASAAALSDGATISAQSP